MATATEPRWSTLRTAAVLALAISSLVLNALPAITGVLARELGLTASVIGLFASANALGGVLGGALAVILMRSMAPRATAMIGLILLLSANVCSALFGFGGALVALRALGGVGTGLTISACYYVFSLKDRERNIAASLVVQTASAFVVITILPTLVQWFGWRAMFLGIGALVIPCLLFARSFPNSYEDEKSEVTETAETSRILEWVGLIAVALSSLAILSMWAYLERIGSSAGISPAQITTALSVCTIFGFISSAIVLVLGDRVTGPAPLIFCLFLNIVGVIASAHPNWWIYTAAISAYYFSLPIYLAAQFGSIMRKASTKRFAAQYVLAGKAGALGPAIGGFIAERFGFASVRWFAIVLLVGAASLLWLGFIKSFATPVAVRA